VSRGPAPEADELSILRAFLSDDDPAYVLSEIADKLEMNKETVRHQIKQKELVERGLLKRKKPGSRTVLYWITPEGVQYYVEQTGND